MKDINLISGKDSYMLAMETLRRIKLLASEKKKIILIVPAQYTLTAEKFYMESLGEQLMAYVQITTLTRMAKKYFTENGASYKFIGKAGKNVLLAKAYTQMNDRLKKFKGYYNINFIEELSSQIGDFKNFGVAPDVFSDAVAENERLYDISLIYSAYNALLGQEIADGDDVLGLFAEGILRSGIFESQYVFVDFFKYMSSSELSVIKSMCEDEAELTLTLITSDLNGQDDIFSPLRRVYHSLKKFAHRAGIKIINTDLSGVTVNKPLSLSFILENLYTEQIKTCDDYNGIALYRAADPGDELDFIACEITRLVRDCGYCYNDFAVITRNPETYASVAEAVFSQYEIPVFWHRKGYVTQKLAARFLSSLLSVIVDGYKTDTVLDLLRCGVFDIDKESISSFEKYVNVWNVRYGEFKKPFIKNINGFRAMDDMTVEDRDALNSAELVRDKIITVTESFREQIKDATVEKISRCIYKIFKDVDMEKHLQNVGEEYKRYGENALYSENLQVYELLLSTLDEFVSVCGDEKMSIDKYRDLLNLILSSVDIGIIPTSLDEVLSGDAATAPLTGRRCVFVYGLYDGSFPANVNDTKLISANEREQLEKAGIRVGLSADDEVLYENFLAYFAITGASERLYLSYPAVFGDEKKPSEPFRQIQNMFPGISIIPSPDSAVEGSSDNRIQKMRPTFGLYTKMNAESLKYIFTNTKFEKFLSSAEKQKNMLSLETSSRLFGTKMNLTPSRSDTYSHCPYSYFLQYGLYVREELQAKFNPVNTGTFLHDLLEQIIGKPGWLKFSISELDREVQGCVNMFFKNIFGEESPSASFTEYAKNLSKKALNLLLIFKEEFLQSKFKPVAFELPICDGGEVSPIKLEISGGEIRLGGKVDRIDAYIDADKTYLRIADYKSHNKKLCFTDIYSGVNIQLLCYLYALRENGKVKFGNVVPAGVTYVNVKPTIKKLERGKTPPGDELESSGLFLADINVLSAMENGLCGKYIPVTEKTINGENVISEAQFETTFCHIKKVFSQMGENLLAGNIEKAPIAATLAGDKCPYCPIRTVCEEKESPRLQEKLKKEEFFNVLIREGELDGLDAGTTKSNI